MTCQLNDDGLSSGCSRPLSVVEDATVAGTERAGILRAPEHTAASAERRPGRAHGATTGAVTNCSAPVSPSVNGASAGRSHPAPAPTAPRSESGVQPSNAGPISWTPIGRPSAG